VKTIRVLIIAAATLLLAFSPTVASVYAACGPGNASDSWTPRAGVTFTISSTACPGTYPKHTVSSSRTDSSLIPQNSNFTYTDIDNISPNTGTRVSQSFSTGLGVLPSDTHTYGPFSGNAIPNCGYTDFAILVLDNATGQTHVLQADSYGQTAGTCPI
jgi:hypothetical protein